MDDKTEPKPTAYLILERRLVSSFKDPVQIKDLAEDPDSVEMWEPLAISPGRDKNDAIDAFVGDREGTFKAVSATAWKGGKTIKQITKVTSEPWEERSRGASLLLILHRLGVLLLLGG